MQHSELVVAHIQCCQGGHTHQSRWKLPRRGRVGGRNVFQCVWECVLGGKNKYAYTHIYIYTDVNVHKKDQPLQELVVADGEFCECSHIAAQAFRQHSELVVAHIQFREWELFKHSGQLGELTVACHEQLELLELTQCFWKTLM